MREKERNERKETVALVWLGVKWAKSCYFKTSKSTGLYINLDQKVHRPLQNTNHQVADQLHTKHEVHSSSEHKP